MKLSELIKELEYVKTNHGDIDCELQVAPGDVAYETITGHPAFFIVPEQYDDGWQCNLRAWPY